MRHAAVAMELELPPLWILDHADIAGGGQRSALRLARHAAAQGGEVMMVCPEGSTLAAWCREAQVPVLDAEFPQFHPSAVTRVARALRRARSLLRSAPDDALLVANAARVQAYLFAASRLGTPARRVVNVMHEQDSARRPSARFAYRRFGELLVIGDGAAAAYRERLPGVTVRHANNFLLGSEFEELAHLRGRPERGGGPVALGTIGRLIPEKGLVELVGELAAEEVRPLWRHLTVAAFSEDPAYESTLSERIAELGLKGVVELVGARPAAKVLERVDALVVPSVGHEAQPTVIIEALAAGVPVIVRSAVWSDAFDALAVRRYASIRELAAALATLPAEPAPPKALAGRFGPQQFLAALLEARE